MHAAREAGERTDTGAALLKEAAEMRASTATDDRCHIGRKMDGGMTATAQTYDKEEMAR